MKECQRHEISDQQPVIIAVVGPSECDDEIYGLAREVGRLLAHTGAIVATGGESGVMEAAARGAFEVGGVTLGFLPGLDLTLANRYLTVPCPTGLGEARNALLVAASRGLVAVGASWGTESEIALGIRTNKPVVTVGGWTRYDSDGRVVEGVIAASGAPEAVRVFIGRLG